MAHSKQTRGSWLCRSNEWIPTMETETIRRLTVAADAIREAQAGTNCGAVDDHCVAAFESLRSAIKAAVFGSDDAE